MLHELGQSHMLLRLSDIGSGCNRPNSLPMMHFCLMIMSHCHILLLNDISHHLYGSDNLIHLRGRLGIGRRFEQPHNP